MEEGSSLVWLAVRARCGGKYWESAKLLKEAAAEKQNAEALWMLARAYEFGELCQPIDEGKAMALYESACALGYGPALADLSFLKRREGAVDESAALAAAAMASGNPFALGQCYMHGLGVEQDDVAASESYQKAAEKDESTTNIGSFGVLKLGALHYRRERWECSLPFLEKAAKSGHAEGQFLYGTLIHRGLCGDKKPAPKAAFHWLREAARQGRTRAYLPCASILLIPRLSNAREGALWLIKAYHSEVPFSARVLQKRIEGSDEVAQLSEGERLRELFVYGGEFAAQRMRLDEMPSALVALNIYQESRGSCTACIVALLGCWKFRPASLLQRRICKDTLRLVCQMIHESATSPLEWGVGVADVKDPEQGVPSME